MAQLPYIEPEAADPITKKVYDKTVVRFQMILSIFKISGNAPEIAEKMSEQINMSFPFAYTKVPG